jgi:predicted DNA-binding transcriptional regulator YafY
MKADRLLSALLLLQAHGRMTGRELARRLEVSIRTVHRDMEALAASGVPVYALRGASGGWQLEENWRTRVPGLDESELRALLMAQPRVVGDSRLAQAAQRAIDKLMAAMPASMREQAASIRQRLHVDTAGWSGRSESLVSLPVVQEAVARDRKLAFIYVKGRTERADRTVDPLGLVAKGVTWYLVANTPNGFRTYRVSRIEQARLLEAPCRRPPNFDLAEYWKTSTEEYRKTRMRYEAVLRVESRAAASMMHWWTTAEVAPPEEVDGTTWRTLRVRFDDEEQACFIALGMGPRAEVLEPAVLRDRVTADIASMSRRGQS